MSQQLLHRTNIGATIHQVSRRRMTQNVRTRRLSILHRAQQAGQVLTNLTGIRTPTRGPINSAVTPCAPSGIHCGRP